MKLSDKPTTHVLIKANTTSTWDYCEFAIIHLSERWRKLQAKRLEGVKPFADDDYFSSMCFYDTSVDFYQTEYEGEPDIEKLLADKDWIFVEVDDDETERWPAPENSLDCHKLVIYRDGSAIYKAYGKHTNEEFWTNEFLLQQLTGTTVETRL